MKQNYLKVWGILWLCQLGWISGYGQTSIAFLGQAATYTDNIPAAQDGFTYDDDRAAAVWFMDTFLPAHPDITGTYFSFQDVAEGTDISGYDVLWIQSDGATYPDRLNEWPRGTMETNGDRHCVIRETGFQWNGAGTADSGVCIGLEDAFINSIRSFYENGGHVFLGNYAGKALEVLGVFDGLTNPWEYRPNQVFGDVTVNAANTAGAWGTRWGGSASSPLIAGMATTSVAGCGFSDTYLEFLTADTEKKNRACQYNLDWGRISDDTPGGVLADKRVTFETTLNAEILLENCNGNEIQGALFQPNSTGDGTVIWYGAGVYDWYAPGTGNNSAVKQITENALLYLTGLTLSVPSVGLDHIRIYPNPAKDQLHIDSNVPVRISVYTTTGQWVISGTEPTLDVAELQSGLYLVQLTDDSGNTTYSKVMIQP